MDYHVIFTIEPGKRGGKPCIRHRRITVYDVLSYLAAGMIPKEVLAHFPYLAEEDVRACLRDAADRERHTPGFMQLLSELVSKDADFSELRQQQEAIKQLEADATIGILTLVYESTRCD